VGSRLRLRNNLPPTWEEDFFNEEELFFFPLSLSSHRHTARITTATVDQMLYMSTTRPLHYLAAAAHAVVFVATCGWSDRFPLAADS